MVKEFVRSYDNPQAMILPGGFTEEVSISLLFPANLRLLSIYLHLLLADH